MSGDAEKPTGFHSYPWRYAYKTSSSGPDSEPVNILHDFYIPVLKRSITYDRVAGYFRSSSLAATSQGYSAFTNISGKMRLIVGADLKPDDVSAILKGDEKRLIIGLRHELKSPEKWPEDIKRGVELLSWMVARGILEVKVGFRIHKNTLEPVEFTEPNDGYVHEKWAVFTDISGNRIYISGSLNESRQALVHNAENIEVHADWWGDIERQRTEDAKIAFERLWNNENPCINIMTLPQAVKQRMIEIGKNVKCPLEIDGSCAITPDIEPPSALERLKFALIKNGPRLPYGRFVGMETAPVRPWPHQEVVARRLIQTWPYNYLLCDEVGLGKTIEAGLAIRSLYLSGLVQRVLVSPPASLTRQWHREMASKFFLPFARAKGGHVVTHKYIFPCEEIRAAKGIYDPNLCIVSTGLLSRKQRHKDLQKSRPFDLTLIDEAHYARRKNPKNGKRRDPTFGLLYKSIRDFISPKTQCLWMATATPMQLDWIEVFDLIRLTSRVGHFQKEPTLTSAFYRVLGKLIRGQEVVTDEWDFLRRAISLIERYDPFLWEFIKEAVVDGRIRTATRQWLHLGRIPRGIDRKNISRLIFASAPLSRVMLRHTRPLLEIYRKNGQLGENLAKREILEVPRIVLSGIEKKAYKSLESYCQELVEQISAHTEGSKKKGVTH